MNFLFCFVEEFFLFTVTPKLIEFWWYWKVKKKENPDSLFLYHSAIGHRNPNGKKTASEINFTSSRFKKTINFRAKNCPLLVTCAKRNENIPIPGTSQVGQIKLNNRAIINNVLMIPWWWWWSMIKTKLVDSNLFSRCLKAASIRRHNRHDKFVVYFNLGHCSIVSWFCST